MGELQKRRDAQTRAELSGAAIALFAEQGFVETTMADVAAAAGVSRRTAYRHYQNKEDLLFDHSRRWLETFHAVVDGRLAGESTRTVCSRAVLEVARAIEATREEVLTGYGVIAVTPSLRSAYAQTNRNWLEAYTVLIGAGVDDSDAEANLDVSVIAGALVGGTDRAALHWALNPEVSLIALTEHVLDSVEPLWPDESRTAS